MTAGKGCEDQAKKLGNFECIYYGPKDGNMRSQVSRLKEVLDLKVG